MTSTERRQYWQTIIEQQTESGLSKAAFCREQRIPQQTFFYWSKKLKAPEAPQRILPVAIAESNPPNTGTQLEVQLPCLTLLRFSEQLSPDRLGQYLAVLSA